MRFAVAISILSQTLSTVVASSDALLASSNGGIKEETKEQHPAIIGSAYFPFSEAGGRPQYRVPRHRHSLLLNSKPTSLTNSRIECDPTSDNDDIGLLSCGAGRYCAETSSLNSSLGGVCTDQKETKDLLLELKQASRRRQQVVGTKTFFQLAETFCDRNQDSCDCSAMDFDAYNGEFTCNFDFDCIYAASGCTNEDEEDDMDTFQVCESEVFTGKAKRKYSYSYTSW